MSTDESVTSSGNNANNLVGGSPSLSEKRVIEFKVWLHSINKMTVPLPIEGWAKCAPFGCDLIWLEFTGLKDKNGKKIYEGDILKYSMPNYPEKGLAEYIEEVSFVDGVFTLDGYAPVYTGNETGEVIGNIYENPELLRTVQQ